MPYTWILQHLPTTEQGYGSIRLALPSLYERLHSWKRVLEMVGVHVNSSYAAEVSIWCNVCPDISVQVFGVTQEDLKLQEVSVLAQMNVPSFSFAAESELLSEDYITCQAVLMRPERCAGSPDQLNGIKVSGQSSGKLICHMPHVT